MVHDLETQRSSLKPTDIIVINETPLSLPVVSGILVSEFNPLSHLTILGQNHEIPIAAYRLAFEDAALIKLEEQHGVLPFPGTGRWSHRRNSL